MIDRVRRGMSLMEVVVAMAILSSVIGIIAQSFRSGAMMSTQLQVTMAADVLAERAVRLISADIKAGKHTPNPGNTISVQICTGIDAAGAPVYGETHTWSLSATGTLSETIQPATGPAYTVVIGQGFDGSRALVADQGNGQYIVTLSTLFTDAAGNTQYQDGTRLARTASSQVFTRGYLLPAGGAGSTTAGGSTGGTTSGGTATGGTPTGGTTTGGTPTGGSTTGGTPTGGTTTGGTPTGGSTTGGTPTGGTTSGGTPTGGTTGGGTPTGGTTGGGNVKVIPTLHISLVRSSNGKNLTGTVSATVTGDTITSLAMSDDQPTVTSTTAPSGYGSGSASMTVSMTNVKSTAVTVTVTATTSSGGSATVTQTASATGGISY